MRFGLVGTGPWANLAHAPGLAAAAGVELVGVWGRRPAEAAKLADRLGAAAYDDYSAMLTDVDAVAFAVPPNIQTEMALDAVAAGKHLLLDKPIALDVDGARRLVDAVTAAGVASVVFFTDRFVPASRVWFDNASRDGVLGGWMRWFSALQEPDNPFGAAQWRHERGALWDIGPHALSTLSTALGPIDSLVAVAGTGDLVILTLRHASGATSTATLSQFAPPAAVCFEAAVWGEHGLSVMPGRPDGGQVDALQLAAEELVAAAQSGDRHPVDVVFGARVVELLADAQRQVDAQR